jgi:hypothetical protein
MQLNKMIEFRQQIYDHALTKARDAQFELIDALLSNRTIQSFPELSLAPLCQRQWHSVYAALEQGEQDQAWLTDFFIQQLPNAPVRVFALDKTVWCHPRSRTLADLMYEYSPTRSIKTSIVRGHPYSLLTWVPQPGKSWALPISSERVTPHKSALETGSQQVKVLSQARSGFEGVNVVVGDGSYGNHEFLGALADQECALLVRLRCDRVLYGPAPPYGGRGRPRKHGERFAFKDLDTWRSPSLTVTLNTEHCGLVRLRRWDHFHAKQAAAVVFSVLYCEVHLEREQPPKPLWLAYRPAPQRDFDLATIWRWYALRWPIEPSIRFRKERLYWDLPQVQQTERCDRWTTLVAITYWMIWLARDVVRDRPLPWQKPLDNLTPGRVLQGFDTLFAQLGTPVRQPQTRGKSPGWLKGRKRSPPQRHKVIKRGKKRAKKT